MGDNGDKKVTLLDISDKTKPEAISTFETLDSVYSIAKIDENNVCFGGKDGKFTILDISDKKNPKEIINYMQLEDDIWQLEYKNRVTIRSNRTLSKQDLYKYAWFANRYTGECVPYYMFEDSDRVRISSDKREITLYN